MSEIMQCSLKNTRRKKWRFLPKNEDKIVLEDDFITLPHVLGKKKKMPGEYSFRTSNSRIYCHS